MVYVIDEFNGPDGQAKQEIVFELETSKGESGSQS